MATLLDRARSLFTTPADRRMAAFLAAAPAPVIATRGPFDPEPGERPLAPPSHWMVDQPPPPAARQTFVAGYHNKTFQAFSAPMAFDFDIERIRNACSMHRQGIFLESSALAVAVLGFAPVLACLQQAMSPFLALDRHILGGSRGLARLVAEEIEEQLAPRGGLLPSPYFPPTLWGTIGFYLIFMGFAVLQHVDGEPDPETGVRPRYTRLWPPWAVTYYRQRRTFVAMTTSGPVDILNDGHFTLVADDDEPHFSAAVLAVGEETLGGRLTQQSRNTWINRYGSPKWVGTMPEKIATMSPEGEAFFAALATITGPDGIGALPFGSKFETVGLKGEASDSFKEALDSVIIHIAMAILGSDGTIRAGGEGGAGPYRAPGFWAVRHDLNMRRLMCVIRGVNQGHVAPYIDFNYSAGVALAKERGIWTAPALNIPLPDPDADTRILALAGRQTALYESVKAEKEAGGVVDQERVNALAKMYEANAFILAEKTPTGAQIFAYHIEQKAVAIDEVREPLGLPPLPHGAGSLDRLAEERLAGKDETGGAPPADGAPTKDPPASTDESQDDD